MQVSNCARCGGDHDVEPKKLERPFAPPEAAPVVWERWATCPTNGDPIMIATRNDGATLENDFTPHGTQQFEDALPIVFRVFQACLSGFHPTLPSVVPG